MSAATLQSDAPVDPLDETAPARRRNNRPHRLQLATVLAAAGFVAAAAYLRLVNITTSYDLFIDETTYAAIARDTTLAAGPMLHGLPFVLHPPLAFLLLAAPTTLLDTQSTAALVAGMRPVSAIAGALIAGILYLTLHRAGFRKGAVTAAGLVTLDPLIISFDSRVMLEAFAQLFAVLTIAAAIRAVTARPGARWRWSALAAVAGAATFGTKETFGLVVLVTLLVVALTSSRGQRRLPLIAAGGTLVGYALINVVMVDWGGLGLWWHMRTDGLMRLLGIHQPTGFKAEGVEGSFWERVLPNGAELGGTYAILALGGVSAISLLWSILRRRAPVLELSPAGLAAARIVSVWAVVACGYVAYAVVFGSLEEQMFYIAALPCAASLAIRVVLLGRSLRRVAVVGVAVILLAQGAAWVVVHSTPDDVYARMLDQIPAVAPEGSTIAVTEETGQFVLSGYELGQWATASELKANDVDYVLLSERLVEHGYGLIDADVAADVRAHGSRVLSIRGRENDLQLYDVREWTGADLSAISTTGDKS